MDRKTILFIVLGLAIITAAGFWLVGRSDPSKPTAAAPAGPNASAKATEEQDFNLPPLSNR